MYQIITQVSLWLWTKALREKNSSSLPCVHISQHKVNKGAMWEAGGGEVGHRVAFEAERKACAKAQSMRSPACLWS